MDQTLIQENKINGLEIAQVENIIKDYLNKNKIQFKVLQFQKTTEGLSNFIYFVKVDDEKQLFLKIFNNTVDRYFEGKLIQLNSEKGYCAKILDTDFKVYRIEEYLLNVEKLKRFEILSENFYDILNIKLIKFNLLIPYNKEIHKDKNVFNVLKNTFNNAQNTFQKFMSEFNKWKIENNFISKINGNNYECYYSKESDECKMLFDSFTYENIEKIEKYLKFNKLEEILESIFPKEFIEKVSPEGKTTLEDLPLYLTHNDVHIYNFLYKNNEIIKEEKKIFTEENLFLIDYEYSCFNIIGFDLVNFLIENFFDLEKPEYPYYSRLVNNTTDIYDKTNYYKYIEYLNKFIIHTELENKGIINFNFDILKSEEYFKKICRLASIFWFYTALQFLDFFSNVNKLSFNYIDYSIDRLSIYEQFNI